MNPLFSKLFGAFTRWMTGRPLGFLVETVVRSTSQMEDGVVMMLQGRGQGTTCSDPALLVQFDNLASATPELGASCPRTRGWGRRSCAALRIELPGLLTFDEETPWP